MIPYDACARWFLLASVAMSVGACSASPPTAVPVAVEDGSGAWGPEEDGLRTRLSFLDVAWAPGQPLRVRLELRNFGDVARTYDTQQIDVNDPFDVLGPGGRPVAWIGGSVQTLGTPRPIAPGETVVLLDAFDIARGYLMTRPGEYRLRLRRQRGIGIPTSNTILVCAEAGVVSPERALLERLREILPEGWKLSADDAMGRTAGTAFTCAIHYVPPSHLKMDVRSVNLVFTAARVLPEAVSRWGGEPAQFTAAYLGEASLGHAWLVSQEGAEAAWPGHRATIAAALGLPAARMLGE